MVVVNTVYRTNALSPLTLARHGKPQCKNCHIAFTSWRRFFLHVERHCCQALPPAAAPLMYEGDPTVEMPVEPANYGSNMPASVNDPAQPLPARFAAEVEPFWSLLSTVAQTAAYDRLTEDARLGESLAHHCIICGTWCNRCQELNLHYRLHHPKDMPGTLARSAQITHQLNSPSPCNLCQKAYRRGHCCPVATQVAALQLHHLMPEDRSIASRTCIMCQQVMDNMCQLHQHLARHHEIQVHDWCPSRDGLQNSSACAHCGSIFESRSGLQRHILDGRCAQFDPDASPQPLDAASKWMPTLIQGNFTRSALSPGQRQDLTLVCQMCGTRYGRQNDLGAHLQQAHSPLWMASQEMLRFLIQTVQAKNGCQCTPGCHDQGKTHICMMLRQFAMMYMTSPCDLLVPTQFSQDLLDTLLQPILHLPLHQPLKEILQSRQFENLWLTPGTAGLLKQWCVKCGDHFHPAALVIHHWQRHGEYSQWATQIKFQLFACLLRLQDQDNQCNFCGLMINPPLPLDADSTPDRLLTMQTHFASNCPIVHQVALLLQPIHGSEHGHGSPRSGTPGIVQALGTSSPGSQPIQTRKDEEPHAKRPKQEDKGDAEQPLTKQQVQNAMMSMMKIMATLVLQHEKSVQLLHRQDSFVFYAQVSPQGAIPLLTQLAVEWKDLYKKNPEGMKLPTMRTFLLRGLIKEVHQRVQKMGKSKAGEDLWDKAIQTGVLQKDGAWTYHKWSHEEKCLIPAGRDPLPMTRVLRQLQHQEELLEDSTHVVRFHSLKAQTTVIPWYLQVSMRQDDCALILGELQQLGIWSFMGLSLKAHNQTQSKQAQLLQQCLQQTSGTAKSKGKGKHGKSKGR